MKSLVFALAAVSLAACGVETAGTAASAAAMKKQEIEQGKKTMQDAQQKIDQAVQAGAQRTQSEEEQSQK